MTTPRACSGARQTRISTSPRQPGPSSRTSPRPRRAVNAHQETSDMYAAHVPRARALRVRPAHHTSSEPRLNSARQVPRTRSRCEQHYLLAVGDDSTHRGAIASLASTSVIPQLEVHDRAGCARPCMPRAVMHIAPSYAHRPVLRAHVRSRTADFLPRPTRVAGPVSPCRQPRTHPQRRPTHTRASPPSRCPSAATPFIWSSPPLTAVLAISWV